MEAELAEVFAAHGLNLQRLMDEVEGLALVGSRACNCARIDSDWDVVVIGDRPGWLANTGDLGRQERALPKLEVMFEQPDKDPDWLARDQAQHCLVYGVWLKGAPTWTLEDIQWERAVALKRHAIEREMRCVLDAHTKCALRASFLEKQYRRLVVWSRYLECSQRQHPCPPRAALPQTYDQSLIRPLRDVVDEIVGHTLWRDDLSSPRVPRGLVPYWDS